MSVQDIIFAASGGASSPTSIEYQVGVYDLPISANWSALVYTGDKTVIVGDNKFVTITDPADQSTMVYGDLPMKVRSTLNKLVCINQTILIPGKGLNNWPGYPIKSLDGGLTWAIHYVNDITINSYSYEPTDITPLSTKDGFNVRLCSYNQSDTYMRYSRLGIIPSNLYNMGSHYDTATSYQTATFTIMGSTNESQKYWKTPGFALPRIQQGLTKSYAHGKLNGVDTYAYIGNDGFLYESTNNVTYTKNTSTIIPTGTYLDITFAGGKFCAPIANTNKFVVIG